MEFKKKMKQRLVIAISYILFGVALTVIVLSLLNCPDLAQPLAWFVCLMTVLYWVFYLVARRKY